MKYAKEVKRHIKTDTDWRYLATGGYWILISLDGDFLHADVLVDPAVGTDNDLDMAKI